jgi:outer membrane protein
MKNISLILNAVLLLAVGHLYYLNLGQKKSAPESMTVAPSSSAPGVRIAYVNADTLDAKYEWLKKQKEAIEQRARSAESSLQSKQESLMRDAAALQEKFQSGTMTRADAEKAQADLMAREQRLGEEQQRLSKQLSEEQRKALNDLYANVEGKLKTLSDQIGYDYILSYSRGGQILLASDSLDITKQVLMLLNAKEAEKPK